MKKSQFDLIFIRRSIILVPVIAVILFSFGGCNSSPPSFNPNKKGLSKGSAYSIEYLPNGSSIIKLKTSSAEQPRPCGDNSPILNSSAVQAAMQYMWTHGYDSTSVNNRREMMAVIKHVGGNIYTVTPLEATWSDANMWRGYIPSGRNIVGLLHSHVAFNHQKYTYQNDWRHFRHVGLPRDTSFYYYSRGVSSADSAVVAQTGYPMYVFDGAHIRYINPAYPGYYTRNWSRDNCY